MTVFSLFGHILVSMLNTATEFAPKKISFGGRVTFKGSPPFWRGV